MTKDRSSSVVEMSIDGEEGFEKDGHQERVVGVLQAEQDLTPFCRVSFLCAKEDVGPTLRLDSLRSGSGNTPSFRRPGTLFKTLGKEKERTTLTL